MTLPEPLIAAAEAAVAAGEARSVSSWIAATAGAGEAKMTFEQVMSTWAADVSAASTEERLAVADRAAEFMTRQRLRDDRQGA